MVKSPHLAILTLTVCLLAGVSCFVLALPPSDIATCKISCTVAGVAEWSETHFSDIDLGELAADNKQVTGETALILYTNGDVIITADNSNAAELSFGSHTLMTKYKLKYNGLGIKQTGNNSTIWYPFDTFLKEGTDILHTPTEGAVEVILSVEASVKEITPQNSGQYNAVQTLTACWKS
jgi:hypothetical protein